MITYKPTDGEPYTLEVNGFVKVNEECFLNFPDTPEQPRTVNLGYRTQVNKRTIKFDDISIGGNANPRFTVPIKTDRQTTRINTDLNDLQNSFDESKDNFIELTNLLESHLSKRHYIN